MSWDTAPLQYVAEIDPSKSEVASLPDDLDVSFLPMEAVGVGGVFDPEEDRSLGDVRRGYTYLREGDLGFAKISPSFQNGKSGRAAGLTNGVAFATTELIVLRPHSVDGRFLAYVLGSRTFLESGTATLYGVAGQKRVSSDWVASFPVPLPPLEEQRRIADYLDTETARIDTLLTKNNRASALVSERYYAYIDRAFWAEEFPRRRLSAVCDPARPIRYGIVLPGPSVDVGVPLIKGGDVHQGTLSTGTQSRVAYEIEAAHRRSRVVPGDLVYTIRGSYGDVAVVPAHMEFANLTQDVARVAPLTVSQAWLRFVLDAPSARRYAAVIATGATIKGVNIGDLRMMPVPAPEEDAQTRVVEAAIKTADTLHQAELRLEQQRELLRERRQALVTAAVTGGIEV